MRDHFYLAERDLPETYGFDPGFSKGMSQDASAMAFAARRARYFSKRAQDSLLGTEKQAHTSTFSKKENPEA